MLLMKPWLRPAGRGRTIIAASIGVATMAALTLSTAAANAAPARTHDFPHFHRDGLGIAPGKIKHVWLIILENKSYDATFTGLNNNTYLWKTLPAQGVLLKNYYGTGHFSLDNYTSLVSGQATNPDGQADCPFYDTFSGSVDLTGSLHRNADYGQFVSAQGANA